MVRIGFTGDFCPWLRIEESYQRGLWKDAFREILPFFQENDLNVIELECPLVVEGTPMEKTGPHLKAHPDTAGILSYLNCKLVATANNHFKDYSLQGMESSYSALRQNNVNWMGSGLNLTEASKPFVSNIGDIKFALINVAENEWTTTFGDEPGCNPLDLVNVFNVIKSIKNEADFIIVSVHGGHEHYNLPSPRMKKWYRFFVDAGADAVVGHHTHTISGYEVYNNSPIFYGLGNFCFDWKTHRNHPWNYGMLLRLNFEKHKPVQFEFEFVEQNNNEAGVFPATEEKRDQILKGISGLNEIIKDDVSLEKSYSAYLSGWQSLLETWVQPYTGRVLPALHKRGFLPSLIGSKKKILFLNLIRCESHRDVFIHSLTKQ